MLKRTEQVLLLLIALLLAGCSECTGSRGSWKIVTRDGDFILDSRPTVTVDGTLTTVHCTLKDGRSRQLIFGAGYGFMIRSPYYKGDPHAEAR